MEETIRKKDKPLLLVVDDADFERDMLRELLQNEYTILEAADGNECIKLVEEYKSAIDVILLDLMMPVMNGFEVLHKRAQENWFQDIPVIVLTASEDSDDQVKSFEMGANDYILKPIVIGVARARLKNVLESQKRIQMLKDDKDAYKLRAQMDQMTGLYNKMTIQSMIDNSLKNRGDGYNALLAVDIDNFKRVNDREGHQNGDEILKYVANQIKSSCRQNDLIGRIGGDEFVICMENLPTMSMARSKAQEILHKIKSGNDISGIGTVSASIGLAFSDSNVKDYNSLFQRADQALQYSKNNGKGIMSEFGREMREVAVDRRKVVILISTNRNVCTTIEEILEDKVRLVTIDEVSQLNRALLKGAGMTGLIYVDVSAKEENDRMVWEEVSQIREISIIPVIAVCKEGSGSQYRRALEYDFVREILSAPLEKEQTTRRTKHYLEF